MLKSIRNNLQDYVSILLPQPPIKDKEFSERIKKRHKIFWKAPNAEVIRNTKMDAGILLKNGRM